MARRAAPSITDTVIETVAVSTEFLPFQILSKGSLSRTHRSSDLRPYSASTHVFIVRMPSPRQWFAWHGETGETAGPRYQRDTIREVSRAAVSRMRYRRPEP